MKSLIIILCLVAAVMPQSLIKKTASESEAGFQTFTVTSYCLAKNRTTSGSFPKAGIIAADLRLFPLGTTIYFPDLGTLTVKDSGRDIRGHRLDLWLSSCSSAIKFGKKILKGKVINHQ